MRLNPLIVILRSWIPALCAAVPALLLWGCNAQSSSQLQSADRHPETESHPSSTASYLEPKAEGGGSPSKACCDKPPGRAALMRNAPPVAGP
jgi:hypothetical protein